MSATSLFLKSALDAFVAARAREADRHVAGVLLGLDEATLRAHGYSRADLKKRAAAYL